jgi:glutamyl-tRNA reductase
MVVGEPQILGQVKAAYTQAKAAGTVGALLEELLTSAFHVAKRIRTETVIGAAAVSISYAAVELAKKIFGNLDGKTVLVIGADKMSELAAKHLLHSGASTIFVANRTHERAAELAGLFGGRAIRFESLPDYIEQSDIIISSTGAPHYIIRKSDAQELLARRKNRPMFFVDIAVPRDIDPEINQLDNIFLYNMDDLQQVVEANCRERAREAQKAEEIVIREVDKLMNRLKALDVVPTIVSLQRRLEEVRAEELERARSKLGPLTPEQEQALEFMTRSIMNKILHSPIQQLKSVTRQPDGLRLVEFVRKVFNLKD